VREVLLGWESINQERIPHYSPIRFKGVYSTQLHSCVYCFYDIQSGLIILAFKSSSPFLLPSWLQEGCTELEKGGMHGSVHSGLCKVLWGQKQHLWGSVIKTLQRVVRKIRENDARVVPKLWATGHGIGAALSTLFLGSFLSEGDLCGIHVMGCYNFGSPKVGDKRWAQFFKESTAENNCVCFRVRNKLDPVTFLPFGLKFTSLLPFFVESSYVHVGDLKWYGPHKLFYCDERYSLLRIVIVWIIGWVDLSVLPFPFHHFPSSYVSSLTNHKAISQNPKDKGKEKVHVI